MQIVNYQSWGKKLKIWKQPLILNHMGYFNKAVYILYTLIFTRGGSNALTIVEYRLLSLSSDVSNTEWEILRFSLCEHWYCLLAKRSIVATDIHKSGAVMGKFIIYHSFFYKRRQFSWNVKFCFLEKNKKNATNLSSAKLAQRLVKFNRSGQSPKLGCV